LKKDNDCDSDIEEGTAQQEGKRCEVLSDRDPVKQGEGTDCGSHRSGASSTNEFQNCIHKQEDQDEIRDIPRLTKPSQVLRVWQ
jgi:hypothetical protein